MFRWMLGPRWLVSATLFSGLLAFLSVRILDTIIGSASGAVAGTARWGVFTGVFTGMFTKISGSGVTSRAQSLRRGNARAKKFLKGD